MTQERNVNKQCGKDNTTNVTLNINVHTTVKFRTGIFCSGIQANGRTEMDWNRR